MTESDWEIVPRPIGFDNLLSGIDAETWPRETNKAGGSKVFGRSPVKDQPSPGIEYGLWLQFDGGRSIGRSAGSDRYLPSLGAEVQEEEKITEITKRHWSNSEDRTCCANSQCRKKFSLIDRPHHCRKCGEVFCNSCVQYRRRLTLLAQYDPEGKSYKVCKACFDEGRDSEGSSRKWTDEFRTFKLRNSQNRNLQKSGRESYTVSRRDRVDLAKECQRLIDGFKKTISSSETMRTLLEMKTMLKTPDWQKSSIWMQEKLTNYCQYCRKEFGLMRKKCSCKICGLALCKSCASHELLIYIPDDSNKNIQEPEIVIIKVIGSPEVEPEISLLLHVCGVCRQYLVELQVSRAENSLRSEEEEKKEGFVTRLIAVDRLIGVLQEKIMSQLTKYQDVIESLEDSRKSSGDRSNTQTLAKAQEDLSDHLASFVLKIEVLKKLKTATQTDTQLVLYKNYIKCKSNFYLDNMSTFRRLRTRLSDSAPPQVLECIQKIVDKNAIISAQVYIRQLIYETIHLCDKHKLEDSIPNILAPLDKVIDSEVTSLLESHGEDCDEHSGHLAEIIKSQMKEHRLIRPSTRSLTRNGQRHVADLMKSRTQEIIHQVSVQLDLKALNKSFTKTKKCLEEASKQAQSVQMELLK